MKTRMRIKYSLSASVLLLLGALLFVTSLPDRSRATDPLANPMPSRKIVGAAESVSTVQQAETNWFLQFFVDLEKRKKRRQVLAEAEASLQTPITFWGRVLDQDDNPVPFATVRYGLQDRFMGSGTGGDTTSDENGTIFITGVKGAGISVKASKVGYDSIHRASAQSYASGMPAGQTLQPMPTADKPAILRLHKKGESEPLLVIGSKNFRVAKDGTPVRVDLTTGAVSETGHLCVQAWTDERPQTIPRWYNWKCRVSVPGGGVAVRTDEFDFDASHQEYREFDEIVMRKDDPDTPWNPDGEREYFLRLPNRTFARIKFEMIAQNDHFFRLESYWNPAPDRGNLEYDPAKRIDQRAISP